MVPTRRATEERKDSMGYFLGIIILLALLGFSVFNYMKYSR
ncbi:hypothetical protein [Tranquillimonas rosea]|nr:hypothetical protein [Tranquillimonas rosea]